MEKKDRNSAEKDKDCQLDGNGRSLGLLLRCSSVTAPLGPAPSSRLAPGPNPWPRLLRLFMRWLLQPDRAGIFFLKRGLELGVIVRLEGGPIESGFDALAIGGAKPKFYRQIPFANARVFL